MYYSRANQQDISTAPKKILSKEVTALRPHNDNIQKGADINIHTRTPVDSDAKEDKSSDLEIDTDKREVGPVGGFLEVTVKQEEEDSINEDSNNITAESPGNIFGYWFQLTVANSGSGDGNF